MKKSFKYLFIIVLALGCVCCQKRQPMHVSGAETTLLLIDSSTDATQDSAYLEQLAPSKQMLEEQLSIPLGQAPAPMSARRPESELLNWACDALLDRARKYHDGRVDLAVVNIGGLRCEWPAGDITFRHVFELMPFDNELVIITLSGEEIYELAYNCVSQGGQGVSKGFCVVGEEGQVADVTLNGQPIDQNATYYVATSDYLTGGADGLSALTHFSERVMTGMKIRDLYIEYIDEKKIVEASIDGRMKID